MYRLPSKSSSSKLCYKCGERPRLSSISYCRECYNTMRKVWRKKSYDPDKQRDNNLRAHFRISQEDYDLMFFRQGGCCAICGKQETRTHPVTGKVWHLRVDHNHKTGQVRELLCNSCNIMIGYIEKDRHYAKKFLDYLKKHDS